MEVAFKAVDLRDHSEEGAVAGEVKFILYKGNHYHLQIRTETGYDLYVDTDDIWDKGDQVGIRILPKDIKAVKK